jgi:hypothetical protein
MSFIKYLISQKYRQKLTQDLIDNCNQIEDKYDELYTVTNK